jgi:hypothetical protein
MVSLLHSQSPHLWHTAGIMSLFPLSLGLIGAVNPASGFTLFGFGKPTSPEARKLGTNLLLF